MRILANAVLLLPLSILIGCADHSASPLGDQAPTDEELVRTNAELVMSAATTFAESNDGAYPSDVASAVNLDGSTLIDLLPGGRHLLNPYTGQRTEPRDGVASSPGDISYLVGTPINFTNNVAVVNGMGADEEIVRLDNLAMLSAQTIEVAERMVQALEEYAAQNFETYPPMVATLVSFDGFDPDLLWQPFIAGQGNPVDGRAGGYGHVGYEPVEASGFYVGYRVTALVTASLEEAEVLVWQQMDEDYRDELVRGNCQLTRYAAQQFAAENAGEHPRDVGTDQSLAGNTLLQLISSRGDMLENPYSAEATEPRDGASLAAGQTGYEPILSGGTVTGFRITGSGSIGLLLVVDGGK